MPPLYKFLNTQLSLPHPPFWHPVTPNTVASFFTTRTLHLVIKMRSIKSKQSALSVEMSI